MTPAETRGLCRAIRSRVPDLHEKGRMLAATPRGRILRGILLESSSSGTRYAWAFVQPLYVPSSTIILSFGMRLGGSSRTWGARDGEALAAAVLREGVPYYSAAATAGDFAEWMHVRDRKDAGAREAIGYSLIAAGRHPEGVRVLRELPDLLPRELPWMRDTHARAERLVASDPGAASALLAEWEAETVKALRLETVP